MSKTQKKKIGLITLKQEPKNNFLKNEFRGDGYCIKEIGSSRYK